MKRANKRQNIFQMNFVEPQQSSCGGLKVKRTKYHISTSDTTSHSEVAELSLPMELPAPEYPEPSDDDRSDLHIHQSDHAKRKMKVAGAWADLRKRFVQIALNGTGFPANASAVQCVFCQHNSASVLCKDCGPQAFLCMECAS